MLILAEGKVPLSIHRGQLGLSHDLIIVVNDFLLKGTKRMRATFAFGHEGAGYSKDETVALRDLRIRKLTTIDHETQMFLESSIIHTFAFVLVEVGPQSHVAEADLGVIANTALVRDLAVDDLVCAIGLVSSTTLPCIEVPYHLLDLTLEDLLDSHKLAHQSFVGIHSLQSRQDEFDIAPSHAPRLLLQFSDRAEPKRNDRVIRLPIERAAEKHVDLVNKENAPFCASISRADLGNACLLGAQYDIKGHGAHVAVCVDESLGQLLEGAIMNHFIDTEVLEDCLKILCIAL